MSKEQKRFVEFHRTRFVERWRWHFQGALCRATAGAESVTLAYAHVADLVRRGVMRPVGTFGVELVK